MVGKPQYLSNASNRYCHSQQIRLTRTAHAEHRGPAAHSGIRGAPPRCSYTNPAELRCAELIAVTLVQEFPYPAADKDGGRQHHTADK
jgi:hypothetical protein